MFRKSIALALALVLPTACSDDTASSNPTGTATTSPLTTGTPGPTTTGPGTTGVTSGTNAGPTTGTTAPSTSTGTSSTTGAVSSSGASGPTTDGVGGATTSGDTTGGTTGGGTEMEWLPSWATSIQLTEDRNAPTENLAGTTLRQFVFPTYTGSQIRIQLSNEKGNVPVEISKVHIARAEPLGTFRPSRSNLC